MRVVYYTYPWFLDHSLSLIRALSKRAEVHVLLDLSPESEHVTWFGQRPQQAIRGISGVHAASGTNAEYPLESAAFLRGVSSFHYIVHTGRRAVLARAAMRTSLSAAAKIRMLRPDVLHFEHVTSRAVPLFFLTPGIPKLLSVHDVHTHPGDASDTRLQKIRSYVLPKTTRLLFHTRYTQRVYTTEYRRRALCKVPSSIVPLGIKEFYREWPGPVSEEREGTVLFLGRLTVYKGVDVLYRALPLVADRFSNLRVIVAGEVMPGFTPPDAPLLPPSVELVTAYGGVDNATLRRLYQEASVVVVPYLEASQSGVIQTAYAFAKPVVATSVGGLAEVVRDGVTGRVVPPGDHQALAEAITELLLAPETRARMRVAIKALEMTEFGWQPIVEQLCAVYAATANRRNPH